MRNFFNRGRAGRSVVRKKMAHDVKRGSCNYFLFLSYNNNNNSIS